MASAKKAKTRQGKNIIIQKQYINDFYPDQKTTSDPYEAIKKRADPLGPFRHDPLLRFQSAPAG